MKTRGNGSLELIRKLGDTAARQLKGFTRDFFEEESFTFHRVYECVNSV